MIHRLRRFIPILLLLLAGCQQPQQATQCAVCTRPIHDGMATLYTDNGKPQVACCPACAFEHGRESGRRTEITQVTDYLSKQPMAPDKAVFVVNSDEHPCSHAQVAAPETGQRLPVHYDRCLPSILAFHDTAAAQGFTREHGGDVLDWPKTLAHLREKKP